MGVLAWVAYDSIVVDSFLKPASFEELHVLALARWPDFSEPEVGPDFKVC